MRCVAVALVASGCGLSLCLDAEGLPASDVLAIGDSFFGWNHPTCQTIPDHVGFALGRRVHNAAIIGARLSGGEQAVEDQVPEGDWSVVLVGGGANDIQGDGWCGQPDNAWYFDTLATENGLNGAMPRLVERFWGTGAHVVIVGYAPLPANASYGFADCQADVATLNARYREVAAARLFVDFLDPAEVLGSEPEAWTLSWDATHPSPEAAARVGRAVAELVEAEAL